MRWFGFSIGEDDSKQKQESTKKEKKVANITEDRWQVRMPVVAVHPHALWGVDIQRINRTVHKHLLAFSDFHRSMSKLRFIAYSFCE